MLTAPTDLATLDAQADRNAVPTPEHVGRLGAFSRPPTASWQRRTSPAARRRGGILGYPTVGHPNWP